jgi:hypothetical protein
MFLHFLSLNEGVLIYTDITSYIPVPKSICTYIFWQLAFITRQNSVDQHKHLIILEYIDFL